jgi:hypothetical protein
MLPRLPVTHATRAGVELEPKVTLNLALRFAATNGLYLRPTLTFQTAPNVGRQTGVQDAVDFGLNFVARLGFWLAA